MIWVETPTNPLLSIADIAAIAEIGHTAGARCWWTTPSPAGAAAAAEPGCRHRSCIPRRSTSVGIPTWWAVRW